MNSFSFLLVVTLLKALGLMEHQSIDFSNEVTNLAGNIDSLHHTDEKYLTCIRSCNLSHEFAKGHSLPKNSARDTTGVFSTCDPNTAFNCSISGDGIESLLLDPIPGKFPSSNPVRQRSRNYNADMLTGFIRET